MLDFWRTYMAPPKQNLTTFLQMDYGFMIKILVLHENKNYAMSLL